MKTHFRTFAALALAAAALQATALIPAFSEEPEDNDTEYQLKSPDGVAALRLDKYVEGIGNRRFKDLEVYAAVHCAHYLTHGTPAVKLKFINHADYERSFLVLAELTNCARARKTFSVRPGGTTEFTLFMPVSFEISRYWYGGSDCITLVETTPRLDGANIGRNIDVSDIEIRSSNLTQPQLLISEKLSAARLHGSKGSLTAAVRSLKTLPTFGISGDSVSKRPPSKGEEKKQPVYSAIIRQFKFPMSDWPRDWRCYSTYDAVLVTEAEYREADPGVKAALDAYRAMGGAVIVAKGEAGFADNAEAVDAVWAIEASCIAMNADVKIRSGYYPSAHEKAKADSLKQVPIEAKSTLPVKLLLLVLAVFALAVVPLAVFRSVRTDRRMRLLAILPGGAAIFSTVIAICALAFFGITPSVRLQSVTFLDQTSKKAFTRGQFGIFSPVSVNGDISFPAEAYFMRRFEWAADRGDLVAGDYIVETKGGQRITGKWVTPLVSAFFDFSLAEERPEKLDFRVSQSGAVKVVNLLGEKVAWGTANIGGQLWEFSDIPPGGSAAAAKADFGLKAMAGAKPPPASFADGAFNACTAFGRDWSAIAEYAKTNAPAMRPGEYVAEVEGSPFFPNPVAGRSTKAKLSSVVYGKFREAAE